MYLAVSSISEKYSSPVGFGSVGLIPRALARPRGLPNGDDFFRENWPRMGSLAITGVPGKGTVFPDWPFETTIESFPEGWLYIHVALRTVDAPMMKDGVMLKSNNATDARKEMTIERLVANPFMMLSEYLMTMAVIRPPNTWIPTVAHAHPPKLRKRSRKNPCELGGLEL